MSSAGPAPLARSLAPRASAPARFPRQPHAARRVSGVTRRQRRPGTRIDEPEPWSRGGEGPRLAERGGERLCAPRPCAGIPRAFRGHSAGPAVATNCCLNTPLGIHSELPGGDMERLAWLPVSLGESGAKPSQHPDGLLSSVYSAAKRVQHVGLGAGTSLGSGPSSASNLLCGLQNPLSCLGLQDGNNTTQNSFYQVCEITCKSGLQTVKCFARVKDCHRGHPVAFLSSSSLQPQLIPHCQSTAQ